MNRYTTAALAAVAIGMFAWITINEQHSISRGELAGRRERLVERFVRARVDRVEIERGGQNLVLEYERPEDGTVGDWTMLEPIQSAADAEAVGSLLGIFEWSDARRMIDGVSAADLETFGLDAPRIVARIVMDGETVTVQVGDDEANGGGVYLTSNDGESVAIAGRDFFEALDHDAAHFRSKRLLERGVLTADRFSIVDSTGPRELVKDGERWTIAGRLAAQGVVDEVLQAITDLEAERYLEEYTAEEPPELDVRASRPAGADESGERVDVRLAVYGACPDHDTERVARFWVDDEPTSPVCVSSTTLDPLRRLGPQYEETRPITFSDLELESLRLVASEDVLTIEREGESDWTMQLNGADAGEVDDQALGDWLRDIRRARATSARDIDESALAAHGLDTPTATLTVVASGQREQILHVGVVTAEGLFVRREGEGTVLVIPSDAEELFTASAARLRPRQILDGDARSTSALTIRRGSVTEIFEPAGADWRVVSPVTGLADRSAVREVLRKVAGLRALRFVADRADTSHGLDAPRFVVVFSLSPDGEEPTDHTLSIGSESRDGAYATLSGTEGVFVVGPTLVDAVRSPLIARDLLATPSYELDAITIRREDGRTVAVRQDGGRFISDDGPADDSRTADLTRALGRLRAETATRYGAAQASDGFEPARAMVEIDRAEGADEPLQYQILIGAVDGSGSVHVRRAGLDVGFLVEEALVESILSYEP